ncbi:MAG: type III pantothenate kinase [Oscillospiraceae bacterium]|nr:type III pantothenate kinase [Oscillospiraceae bacterium]MBQ4486702.1 type III pantothenate kinase [Oscillospiraceae bacterium]MCR5807863.1 type III pantothenate kinase [Oscillospiraceae bacterium]
MKTVLSIDIGNTITEIGCFEYNDKDDHLLFTERISSDFRATAFDDLVIINNTLSINGISPADVKGCIISSVVPNVTVEWSKAAKRFCQKEPMIIGPGIKTGLKILIDNPAQLGSDLVVQAVAINSLYKKACPKAFIDFGTSTTIGVVDKNGSFIGGTLCPGVAVSAEALCGRASQLPRVSFTSPKGIIGKNTTDCLKSGLMYGSASMIDGLLDRIEESLGEELFAVATGSLAPNITQLCRRDITVNEHLLMYGLMMIYRRNLAHI